MTADDHPEVRASDSEREQAIDALRVAAGDGRLTFEELADRVEAASAATTRGALERLTRDLPAGVSPAPGGEVVVAAQQSSVFGDVRRSGTWLVPSQGGWKTCFGDILLDLREARVSAAEVTIEASTVFGNIDLLVPEGIAVERLRERIAHRLLGSPDAR